MNPEALEWLTQRFLVQMMPYVTGAIGLTLISFTPMGKAVVSWLKGHVNRGRAAELAGEIERLRLEVGELQERLDFAERSLTAGTGKTVTPRPTPTLEARVVTPV
jgi:hypothetical protein